MNQQLLMFISGVSCAGVCIFFDIIALAIPYWREASGIYLSDYRYGLWEACSLSVCIEWPSDEVTMELQTTRSVLIIALFFAAGAIAVAVLRQFLLKEDKYTFLFFVSSGLGYAAGILILVGVIVFVVDSENKGSTEFYVYGSGFMLAIVAAICGIGSGGVFTAIQLQKLLN